MDNRVRVPRGQRTRLALVCASLLLLAVVCVRAAGQDRGPSYDIREWLERADKVYASRDVAQLASFYAVDATTSEGKQVTRTWDEYVEHHLQPRSRP